jgi:hypothetical protein
MVVWQPVAFGMLPLGAKPINPPPDLEIEDSRSASQHISNAFSLLHRGNRGGQGENNMEIASSSIEKIGVACVVFVLLALVVSMFRKIGRWRRSHRP